MRSSFPALTVFVTFIVSASAAASGSDCAPLLRGNPQDPLMMSPIAGPSNQQFDNNSLPDSYSVSGAAPARTEAANIDQTPTLSGGGSFPSETPTEGSSTVYEHGEDKLVTSEMLRAELESASSCIDSGHSCLPGWAKPSKSCCPGLTCYPIIIGVGGWCW